MNRKILIILLISFIIITTGFIGLIVYSTNIYDKTTVVTNASTTSQDSEESSTTSPFPIIFSSWIPIFVAIMCTQKSYPVNNTVYFCRGNSKKKADYIAKNVSEKFKSSQKFKKLISLEPNFIKKITDNNRDNKEKGTLLVEMKNGKSYTFIVIKNDTKNINKSSWVIDDILGNEFDES